MGSNPSTGTMYFTDTSLFEVESWRLAVDGQTWYRWQTNIYYHRVADEIVHRSIIAPDLVKLAEYDKRTEEYYARRRAWGKLPWWKRALTPYPKRN